VKTVTVGRVGTTSPMMASRSVTAGSAGMGIPRGSVNNLNHLNRQVVKTGSAEVRPAPQFGATPASRSQSSGGYAASSRGSSMPSSAAHSAPPAGGHTSSGGPVHH
jgi:hypothetical protein